MTNPARDPEMAVITIWSAAKMYSLMVPRTDVDSVFDLIKKGKPFIVLGVVDPVDGHINQTLINPHWIEFVRVTLDGLAQGEDNRGQSSTAYTKIFP